MAVTSHDMRTPLAAVRGYAQLARRHLSGEQQDMASVDRWLGDIDESASRLTSLVSEFMDVTLLRAGQEVPLQLQPTDLVAIVEERVREHQGAAADTHRFTTKVERGLDHRQLGSDAYRARARQPARQRGQVQPGRRRHRGEGRRRRHRCNRLDRRPGHRHRAAGPQPHLPADVPRRQRQRGGRHRARPGRLSPAGGADGRRDHGPQPPGQGCDVHGAVAAGWSGPGAHAGPSRESPQPEAERQRGNSSKAASATGSARACATIRVPPSISA